MREVRRLWPHVGLLLIAATAAFYKSRPEETADRPLEKGETELWKHGVDDLTKVVYETKRQIVTLELRKDDGGRWYFGKIDPAPPKEQPDAGPAPTPVKPTQFVSVSVAEKAMEKLAAMRAKRTIGPVGDDRLEIYGLKETQGTLRMWLKAEERVFVIGGLTPGGNDRYVRDEGDKNVYVIDAAPVRDFEGGGGRLSERNLHAFKTADVEEAQLFSGERQRTVIRSGTEGRRFWADPASVDKNDETVNNWLQKVDRLRPIDYLEKLPEGMRKVVRVVYKDKKGTLGFLELYHRQIVEEVPAAAEKKQADPHDPHGHGLEGEQAEGSGGGEAATTASTPPVKKEKDEYIVTTEQLRLYTTVAESVAEQVDGDLATLLPEATPAPSASP